MSERDCPDDYEPLRGLMAEHGATCSPREFYWDVNEAFHTVEAESYDDVHAGMFLGGEPMWRRLLDAAPSRELRVLDVGSGTGLVGEYVTRLMPGRIRCLTLLDPNAAMLRRARKRSEKWRLGGGTVEFIRGELGAVGDRRFDLVTVSSVLHHVVELAKFCRELAMRVAPDGALVQMQDPGGVPSGDPVLKERRDAATRRRQTPMRFIRGLAGKAIRSVLPIRPRHPLAQATNERLIAKAVITRPMSIEAIWAVTDFHVPGQPGGIGHGIAVDHLARWLAPLRLVDTFTYEFHGLPWDLLSEEERRLERSWWEAGDAHGALFGSAWRAPGPHELTSR